MPRAIRPRVASGSCVTDTTRGSKPAVAAGLSEEAVDGRHDPVVVGEFRQRDRALRSREPMLRGHPHQEAVLEQVDPLGALELAALEGGVLVPECDVELAAQEAPFERARRDLAQEDAKPVVGGPQAPDRGRHEAGERGRERADPHVLAAFPRQVEDLRVGQLQPPSDVIGVLEQHRAGVSQTQPAAAAVAVEEADADLGLQQSDLVRHRRLG